MRLLDRWPEMDPAQGCNYVDIRNAARWFYEEKDKDTWSIYNDFPNVATPWPTAWFEYDYPRRMLIEGKMTKVPTAGYEWVGTFVYGQEVPDNLEKETIRYDLGLAWLNDIFGYNESQAMFDEAKRAKALAAVADENECRWLVLYSVSVASKRRLDRMGFYLLYLDKYGMAIEDTTLAITQDPSMPPGVVESLLYPVWFAMSLLHCKNVDYKNAPVSKQAQKRRRKQGRGEVRYKTLVIDPMRKQSGGEGTGAGTRKAMHICRGHFKDFRDGPGLFGRHNDIYWWDQQLRGKKSRGEVRKAYSVKEGE